MQYIIRKHLIHRFHVGIFFQIFITEEKNLTEIFFQIFMTEKLMNENVVHKLQIANHVHISARFYFSI